MAQHYPDLKDVELDDIRQRVRASIEAIDAGKFAEYEGPEGLGELAAAVKQRGRKRLERHTTGR